MADSIFKPPIEVGPSAMPDTLKALLRQALLAAGSYAAGKGWVNADNINGLVTFVLGVTAAGWGLWATFRRKSQLVVAADAAPNDVARVVPGVTGIGAILPALALLMLPLGGCAAGANMEATATRAVTLSASACRGILAGSNVRAEVATACKLVIAADAIVQSLARSNGGT